MTALGARLAVACGSPATPAVVKWQECLRGKLGELQQEAAVGERSATCAPHVCYLLVQQPDLLLLPLHLLLLVAQLVLVPLSHLA